MTERENYFSIIRRQGYERMPYSYSLCPYLEENFGKRLEAYRAAHGIPAPPVFNARELEFAPFDVNRFRRFYRQPLKEGAQIDRFGVGHEPGSDAAMHMTYMRHPMENMDTREELEGYPYPEFVFDRGYFEEVRDENRRMKQADRVVVGQMQCTIWERAWYLRSMERLMMDMLCEEDLAACLLDKITDMAVTQAEFYAKTGCDILFFGDDIGMQKTVMMSEALYVQWLKPRLKRVCDAAKRINPEIIIFYHSCGFVEPFIGHLIEAGVDVLNPVQPECMDFEEIHRKYGDRLSFHGTLGTQSTMPFGTPEEVRETVFRNLRIAGEKGGLLAVPTHLLEPEVPPENIEAYMQACYDFTQGKK